MSGTTPPSPLFHKQDTADAVTVATTGCRTQPQGFLLSHLLTSKNVGKGWRALSLIALLPTQVHLYNTAIKELALYVGWTFKAYASDTVLSIKRLHVPTLVPSAHPGSFGNPAINIPTNKMWEKTRQTPTQETLVEPIPLSGNNALRQSSIGLKPTETTTLSLFKKTA